MADRAPPIPKPVAAPPTPAPAAGPAPKADLGGVSNSAFGNLDGGGFFAKLGSGLMLSAEAFKSPKGVDLTALPQPLPGIRLTRATRSGKNLKVAATLAVPHLDATDINITVNGEGMASFSGKLQKRLQVPALKSPLVSLTLSEEGAFGGSVTVDSGDLEPKGLKGVSATGGGTLTIENGLFTGNVDGTFTYPRLGSGELHLVAGAGGKISGGGSLKITPPFLSEVSATLAMDDIGNLSGTATVAMTEAKSPIPALSLTGGTLTATYQNGAVTGSLTDFRATYRDLADVSGSATIDKAAGFDGKGEILLKVTGLAEAKGAFKVNNGKVSGALQLDAKAFPEALPVKGQITAKLSEAGKIGFSGTVKVDLGPAGAGELTAAYSEAGQFSLSATIDLKVPGLQSAQVTVSYANGDIAGEGQLAIDPALIPGLTGNATVRYKDRAWSGETELGFSADNGKLNGKIIVTVAQTEAGTLQLGGTGQLEAQIAPRLRGMLTATILPQGGVDVSGRITVTEPLELFPEKRFDKELFKYSQNIPLWAILVAVIRVRAGIRGGIGAGVFRNIVVEGSYTIGSEAADPTFSISGEMFIPAFIEAYVAFGAGLGLDVVIGELTGGIEGVATAGLYGAISVIPELSYANGDWSIEGDATLAAGARLKVGLNAWAEVEALWITVWEETWKLGEWVWNVGPDLALNAHMAYHFGQPGPPEVEFKTSDIDSGSMISEAMPKDGPAPSGAKEALQNKAEWKGKLKEQKQAPVPPALAAQQQAPPPTPPQPAKQPKPKSGPPPAGAAGKAPPKPGAPGSGAAPPPPPGSPGADKKSGAAAVPDPSAKGATPAAQVPGADRPRYPGPITMATLDEPPALVPRTSGQQVEDLGAAKKVIELAMAQANDSDKLDDYFPRIKDRFRLVTLGYVGDFDHGVHIEGSINPNLVITKVEEPVRGTGITAAVGGDWRTEIIHSTTNLGGDKIGIQMVASPLGPDHPLGSAAGGQDALMSQLPTDPGTVPGGLEMFIRGHLLNADLGGAGEDLNQFPITRAANSGHYASIEKQVKAAVNDQKYWVTYKVKVTGASKLIDLTDDNPKTGKPYRSVDATIDAEAAYVTLDKKKQPAFVREQIKSHYDTSKFRKAKSGGLDLPPKPKPVPDSKRGVPDNVVQDPGAAPLLVNKPDSSPVFPSHMRVALALACQKHGEDAVRGLIDKVPNIGTERIAALFAAYHVAQNAADIEGGRDLSKLDLKYRTSFSTVKGMWSQIATIIG